MAAIDSQNMLLAVQTGCCSVSAGGMGVIEELAGRFTAAEHLHLLRDISWTLKFAPPAPLGQMAQGEALRV